MSVFLYENQKSAQDSLACMKPHNRMFAKCQAAENPVA